MVSLERVRYFQFELVARIAAGKGQMCAEYCAANPLVHVAGGSIRYQPQLDVPDDYELIGAVIKAEISRGRHCIIRRQGLAAIIIAKFRINIWNRGRRLDS